MLYTVLLILIKWTAGLNQQVVRLWALVKAHTSPNNVVGRLSFADNDEQPTCDALQQGWFYTTWSKKRVTQYLRFSLV